MAQVQVQRLHLRGPPASTGRAAFRIEDALRTEVVDDGRLILIRRLALGKMAGGSRPRAFPDQLAGAYRRTVDRARHGGDEEAAGADCVWFRDANEARVVLIRLLAAGRQPSGWFWKLAVPDWRDRSLEDWIAEQLRTHVERADGAALAALVTALAMTPAMDVLVNALVAVIGPHGSTFRAPADALPAGRRDMAPQDADRADPPGTRTGYSPPDSDRIVAYRVAALLGAVPRALMFALVQAAGSSGGGTALRMIADALILRQLPELALSPALRRDHAEEWVRQLVDPDRRRIAATPLPAILSSRRGENRDTAQTEPQTRDAPVSGERPAVATLRVSREDPDVVSPPTAAPSMPIFEETQLGAERFSPSAGLLLVIVPLITLGWREWLVDRDALIADAPTARLLHAIARHYRVAADDPVAQLFEPPPTDDGEARDWLAAWRIGLDRWLRRRTRVKLASLVQRPGWITRTDDGAMVRFPVAAADIRLRRRALDRDPGWVDWLGMSIRFAYRDGPEDMWRSMRG